ncbi:probable WRKY transcription factor 41 [Abrus precatorius]|uniref:Probable WRKY transcription factor 41 n=1 Tax=Abrus precatorius TaxID=3816 RepID=A0A8B8KCH0_ABRPR|nr:probable WRKY transcription factor 41 [Abrus precatorius]
MENEWNWEQNTLINELIQGMEVARKLKADLREPYSVETRDLLVQRILSSYEKALLILRYNASTSKLQSMNQATATLLPESPISVNESPQREDVDGVKEMKDHQEIKHDSKKRKIMPKWMDQVRVSCESGLEGSHEDGYNWRKYGQKDILGAKYPRSYYRCTFRNTQGCWATKQVQRSDEDPTIFDITYRGKHTCSQGNNAILAPESPDKQEKAQSYNTDIHNAHPSQENLTRFRNILAVDTNKQENGEMAYPFTFPSASFGCMTQDNHSLIPSALENESFLSSLYQTHLLAPTTPESNYFPSPTFQMNEFDGIYNKPHLESDINEIISTNTSATNSPIPDFNFSLDPAEIDPNFPFNTPGFFC